MPMTPPTAKRLPDHAAANESRVPAMLRVSREGVLVGIEDHLGNDLGLPLTVRASSSDSGVGNVLPMVGGKFAPTQADLLRLFPLPTHRVIADPWTVNIAGATKPAGATITVEAAADEYGGSVIRIDLPAGLANQVVTLPINADLLGAYPKALPETCWRLNVSDWAALSRLYGKLGDATLANCKLWVIIDDSSGGKSQYGCYAGGAHPTRWNGVYRTLRANPFAQVSNVGTMPWDENNPEAEIRALSFVVSTSAATTIRLSRIYSPEWSRGAIVSIHDGGYQTAHDYFLPKFAERGWPGVVSRLAHTEAAFTTAAQWVDYVRAGWDVCQHISIAGNQCTAATTPAQIEQSIHEFKRLVATLGVTGQGNYTFSQFLGNSGRYTGQDMAGLLRQHGIQSCRGMCSDAEYGIDPYEPKFSSNGGTVVQPHGFVPKYGRYNRWQMAAGNEPTAEGRSNYEGSDLQKQLALTETAKNASLIYIHRVVDYDGTNPVVGNVGPRYVDGYIADLSKRLSTCGVIPITAAQLDMLTYNRPGDIYVRWDGEWVSRATGKIVI